MVMSNFSSSIPDPGQDGARWLRIFWAVLTAVLTVAMLVAGGVATMEYATLVFALPVTVIAYLVMASFSKALRMERAEREGQVLRRRTTAAHGGAVPERSWRQRIAGLRSYPSARAVAQFMEKTVRPALTDVSAEFAAQGHDASLRTLPDERTGIFRHTLAVAIDHERDFHYEVAAVEAPVPVFGGRANPEEESYCRLEVFTQTGSEGYDLMGLSRQQVIDDVLDRYEAHLAFLAYSAEHSAASMLTPPAALTAGQVPVLPEGAGSPRT
jgi:choline/glycine/proline betaine transport protein